jgi:NADH-quinone oxidoreductase subunit H
MATLFFGGWDIPFWSGDNAVRGFAADGVTPVIEGLAWWKVILTFGSFATKTGFFMLVFIWVRWTVPRFRYDQIMQLGWKIMLPVSLAYVMVVAATILTLNQVGIREGFVYGLVLTGVSAACTFLFVFTLDRGRTLTGASYGARERLRAKSQASGEEAVIAP